MGMVYISLYSAYKCMKVNTQWYPTVRIEDVEVIMRGSSGCHRTYTLCIKNPAVAYCKATVFLLTTLGVKMN